MRDAGQWLALIAAILFFFAFAGAYIAQAKGRPAFEGVVFGFLLGPIGLLMTVLMPTIKPAAGAGPSPQPNGSKALAAKPKEDERPRSMRRIGGPGDDKAMDFVMEMIRQTEPQPEPDPTSRQLPRVVPSRGLRAEPREGRGPEGDPRP